jgi:predicted outer membrane lipoprotein
MPPAECARRWSLGAGQTNIGSQIAAQALEHAVQKRLPALGISNVARRHSTLLISCAFAALTTLTVEHRWNTASDWATSTAGTAA